MFSLAGPVDAHHQQARFTWGLGPEGAEPLIVGFDVAVTDDDGKLVTVLGFLDKVPGWGRQLGHGAGVSPGQPATAGPDPAGAKPGPPSSSVFITG